LIGGQEAAKVDESFLLPGVSFIWLLSAAFKGKNLCVGPWEKHALRFYIPVKYKLLLNIAFSLAWIGISLYLGWPWIKDMEVRFGVPGAWLIFSGLALLPGWANAFLIGGLLMDRRPIYRIHRSLPPISVLIAAYNEEAFIRETLESVLIQKYPGEVEVIVIDDGSTDNTARVVREVMTRSAGASSFRLRLVCQGRNGGKATALNAGLQEARHQLILTIDADTFMFRDSLARIVTNLVDGPANTAAVAGTVLVRNSRTNLLTRLQEWDYFLGIAVVKRIQSLFQGTLVAQGAFSIYRREVLERLGGWSQTVGEDIVLTWGFHELGYRVAYAENAFVFTNVPESYQQFFRQRQRWARGLIEAIKRHPKIFLRPRLVSPFLYLNLLFPYLDFIFLFVFVPGIIAALIFNYYAIAGLMTLFLLPLTLLINMIMFFRQRHIFHRHGLRVRKNLFGLLFYMLTYQLLMTPASLIGYLSEFLNLRKVWGTKPAHTALWLFAVLLPLLAPAVSHAAAENRAVAAYEFSVDRDREEHHGFYVGYLRTLERPRPSVFGIRTGVLEIRDPSASERFETLRFSWDMEATPALRLLLQGTQLRGDHWSPSLFFASAVWTPVAQWRLELFGERGMVDSVAGIAQKLYLDTAGVSADYLLTDQFTVVGSVFQQWISDHNERLGVVGRFVYTPKRLPWFHLQLYGKKIDSDFDGVGYFSPGRMEEIFLLAGAAHAFAQDNWVIRGQLGPGRQFVDGASKQAWRAEGSLRGWFTPSFGLESRLGYTDARQDRDAYSYLWGGTSLIYTW
jgi:poly-beta-1,6-N-acetyl-D-glucosamine synthase